LFSCCCVSASNSCLIHTGDDAVMLGGSLQADLHSKILLQAGLLEWLLTPKLPLCVAYAAVLLSSRPAL
jgi:hypothetical protein